MHTSHSIYHGHKPVSPVFDYAIQQFYLPNLSSLSTLCGTRKHTVFRSEELTSNQKAHSIQYIPSLFLGRKLS